MKAGQADSVTEGSHHCALACPQTLRHRSRSGAASTETKTNRRPIQAHWSRRCRTDCASHRCCMDTGHCTASISRLTPISIRFITVTAQPSASYVYSCRKPVQSSAACLDLPWAESCEHLLFDIRCLGPPPGSDAPPLSAASQRTTSDKP